MPNIISINTVQINRKCGNNILKKILKLTEVQASIRFFPIEFYLTRVRGRTQKSDNQCREKHSNSGEEELST